MNRFSIALAVTLAAASAARGAADPASADVRTRIPPILWPADGTLTPTGAEVLKEERRFFAEELRHVREWIPDNMRGATTKTWARGQKTMLSESHAVEHVPDMPAEQVERIVAEMENGARNTVLDNIQRFREALAKRVPVFAQALQHCKGGQHGKANETVSVLTKEDVLHAFFLYQYDTLPPYIYCTVTFFEGECFAMDGALHDAAVRYLIVCKGKLPLSLTFSATARMRVADMYEKSERTHFAIPLYQAIAEKFAETLGDTDLLRLHVRARRMMRENPFRNIAAGTGDVRRLMDRARSGPSVQDAQATMLKLMRGIINDEEVETRGHFQINWEMMATEQFQRGGLQEGSAPTKFNFEADALMAGNDDWGKLRPREKQEVIQRFFATYSDEYRDMLEAYFHSMSRTENKPPADRR
ncbi:MAG: hypothetical protein ABR915_20655 [Thermoguttaceae bacterium]|jgi:hypothetical protein